MTITIDPPPPPPAPRKIPPAALSLIRTVGQAIAARRWRGSSEKELQDAVEAMLAQPLGGPHAPFKVEREHRLDEKSRVDFALVLTDEPPPNVVAIELKVAGGSTETARQIQRYAGHPSVAAVILLTTAARLVAAMPPTFGGVRIYATTLRRF